MAADTVLLPSMAKYMEAIELENVANRLKKEGPDDLVWEDECPDFTTILGTDCKEVILPCVLSYLTEKDLSKTAKRLRKAEPEQEWDIEGIPSLEKIFRKWAKNQEKLLKKTQQEKELEAKRKRDKEEEAELLKRMEPAKKKPRVEKEEDYDPIEARKANQRQDWDKWANTLAGKDERLLDGNYRTGDSWGDKAAVDLGAVRGKGFRKEMQKKKRSSWRGGGYIDQACNSFKFDDSDEG
eukprot:GEMP01079490.1.p1 GENE.GEMP01079490.1~~GEMP01079490.1.p1  ORF type:complete len:239 (-),score=59.06 GEMP01079490.1:87-803(-)